MPMRALRFAPLRLALIYYSLTYLYLSCFFFRASFTKGPLQALGASLMAGAIMLAVYAWLVANIERRKVGELALRPRAREFGIGLLAEEWFGSWAALVISSVVFGLAHADAEGATLQGLVSISTWAGLLLVATYLLTGRLWLGIGLHAAWNYTQGTVYSGIVSGNAPPEGFLKSTLQGPDWLTGGAFGVEASVVAVLVCGTTGLVLLVKAVRLGRIKPPAWKRSA